MAILLPAVFAQNHKKVIFRFSPPRFQKRYPGWTLLIGDGSDFVDGRVRGPVAVQSGHPAVRRGRPAVRRTGSTVQSGVPERALGPASFSLRERRWRRRWGRRNRKSGSCAPNWTASFFSPTDLLGTESSREKNLDSWRRWERDGGLAKLQDRLGRAGEKQGIDRAFFSPFFDRIRDGLKKFLRGNSVVFSPLSRKR